MIRGLIFDKDGTLFDFDATWGAFARTLLLAESAGDPALLDRLARRLGFDLVGNAFDRDSIIIAESTATIARAVAEVTGAADVAALTARMNAISAGVPQAPATDLQALMTRLRSRGLTLGVVTNDAEAPALRHLEDAGILDEMAFVAGYDSGHGAKPAPDPLLAFCAATGLAPRDCVMIGDSAHDMAAGRAAGMTCVMVRTGPAAARQPDAMSDGLADAVLDSIADLPDWMDRIA